LLHSVSDATRRKSKMIARLEIAVGKVNFELQLGK
jgi:hypothetical protein